MSQILGKWISDGAITPLKISSDNTSPFLFNAYGIETTGLVHANSLSVDSTCSFTSDASFSKDVHIGGDLEVDGTMTVIVHQEIVSDELTINQTHARNGIHINQSGAAAALMINNTGGDYGAHVYTPNGNVSVLIDSTNTSSTTSTLTIQSETGSGTIEASLQTSSELDIGTLTNHDFSLIRGGANKITMGSSGNSVYGDTAVTGNVNVFGDITGTGNGTFAGSQFGFGTLAPAANAHIYNSTIPENTTVLIDSSTRSGHFNADSVLTVQSQVGVSVTDVVLRAGSSGNRVGTETDNDFKVTRNGNNVIVLSSPGGTDTATIAGDMTVTGNGIFEGSLLLLGTTDPTANVHIYNPGASGATVLIDGSNTGNAFSELTVHTDCVAGAIDAVLETGFNGGFLNRVGTTSDHNFSIIRGGAEVIALTTLGDTTTVTIDGDTTTTGGGFYAGTVSVGALGVGTDFPAAETHIYSVSGATVLIDTTGAFTATSILTVQAQTGTPTINDVVLRADTYTGSVGTTTDNDFNITRSGSPVIVLATSGTTVTGDMTVTGGMEVERNIKAYSSDQVSISAQTDSSTTYSFLEVKADSPNATRILQWGSAAVGSAAGIPYTNLGMMTAWSSHPLMLNTLYNQPIYIAPNSGSVSVPAVTITSTSLGIDTTAPGTPLDVNGAGTIRTDLTVDGTGTIGRLNVFDTNYAIGVLDTTAFVYSGWTGGLRVSSGRTKLTGAFSCNNAEPQGSASVDATATDLGTAIDLLLQIRAALVANGICT
jgi:hypothetical protein